MTACLLLAPLALPVFAEETSVAALHKLFEQQWERDLADNPVFATHRGDARYNDRWRDESLDAYGRRKAADEAVLRQLAQIERAQLPPPEQLNHDLFRREYESRVEAYRYRDFLMPMDQRNGLQTLADEALSALVFRKTRDYEDWIARLESFGRLADQTVALMRQGVKEGRVPPRVLMERLPRQIRAQIVEQPQDSPFYAPFKSMPADLPEETRAWLAQRAATAIRVVVLPGYRRLAQFFDQTYLPASRADIAATALPDGAAYYAFRVRDFTTTALTPEQIHEIGQKEVARIRAEMEALIRATSFDGGFDAFLKYLRGDPSFFHKTGAELFDAYLALCKRVDPELPRLFGRLPRLPYGLRPIPAEVAPDTTTAYYLPGAPALGRAGYYYVNLYQPESRPIWEMQALTLHEAVPGHHLQIALAQELGALPKFRQHSEVTAFVEGWGLYAESLGEELGLYQDPYSKFGQLTYEMWRAVRLVVDTGMHAKGWSRQQAIDYFKANAPKAELDIVNEIDRYIAWPGQALAYKIGELKIKELRARAKARLGEKFDVRAFHDVVLGSGALPLDLLERNVDAWIAQAATAP